MKALKPFAIALIAYACLVAAFETMIGVLQPAPESTLVISVTDASGAENDRVLARLESEGQLYVAANHWPRAWYREAKKNPSVGIHSDQESGRFSLVPVSGDEHERVAAANPLGLGFRFVTGFPPRSFLRLEKDTSATETA